MYIGRTVTIEMLNIYREVLLLLVSDFVKTRGRRGVVVSFKALRVRISLSSGDFMAKNRPLSN